MSRSYENEWADNDQPAVLIVPLNSNDDESAADHQSRHDYAPATWRLTPAAAALAAAAGVDTSTAASDTDGKTKPSSPSSLSPSSTSSTNSILSTSSPPTSLLTPPASQRGGGEGHLSSLLSSGPTTASRPSTPNPNNASAGVGGEATTTMAVEPVGGARRRDIIVTAWFRSFTRGGVRAKQLAVGGLVLIGLFMQRQNHRTVHHNPQGGQRHPGSSQHYRFHSTPDQKQPMLFDVNGPPVPLNDSETILTLLERERREEEQMLLKNYRHQSRQSSTASAVNRPRYPVLKEDDESLPIASRYGKSSRGGGNKALLAADGSSSASSQRIHAAEALLCRKSVVNFVINATDVKDECEGLKKAFDKTCSNNNNNQLNDDGKLENREKSTHPHHRQRRRTLWEKTRHKDNVRLFLFWHWSKLRKVSGALKGWVSGERPECSSSRSPLGFFFSEDAVQGAYEDGYASALVRNGWDELAYRPLLKTWSLQRQQEMEHLWPLFPDPDHESSRSGGDRKLEKGLPKGAEEPDDPSQAASNKTEVVSSITKKQQQQAAPISLDLPTLNEHVSDKVVSETLLLTQGDKIIEKAQNESLAKLREKAEAAQDAHASSKAVADANAAVAALLNDPTSVEARTCCASILSVYHENCSTDDDEQFSDSRLLLMLFVMAVCGIVKSLIRHYKVLWLPEAAGCILVGVLSGYILMFFPHHDISFDGNWFLRVMVPPIVFEAALSIDKRSFNRHIVPIVIFSIAGTLIATVITAYVVHRGTTALSRFCTSIPTVEALTFGALISSIDPIAVLSVLSNMGMTDTDTIYVLIFGESLLNDGVSIVLFQTLVHFLDDTLVIDSAAISAAAVHFFVVAIGSLLIGVASGMMSTVYYWLFHGCQTPLVEVLMFMCWAMLPYYVCDGIEWSGIVAAVANGFVMDLYVRGQAGAEDQAMADDSEDYNIRSNSEQMATRDRSRRRIFSQQGHLSAEARQHIGFVTEILATALETAIFAYLGIFLFSHRYHWNFFHTIIAIFACCFSRAVMIPFMSLFANWITRLQQSRAACRSGHQGGTKKSTPTSAYLSPSSGGPPGVLIDRRMQVVLWFAGLRGAMSFALVEHVPLYDAVSGEGTPFKPELKAMTSASILFTVFILGGYTYYMMEYLGVAPSASGSHRRGSSAANGGHHAYELASLISKVDSGDGDDPLPAGGAVAGARKDATATSSGRQLAFRRQRQTAMISEATSPNHNED